MMKLDFRNVLFLLVPLFAFTACSDDDSPAGNHDGPGSIYEEPTPERPDYVNANLVFYGQDGSSEESDYWVLTLYTDMEVTGGYPVGPGQMLTLALNTKVSETGEPSLECLAGDYHMPSNSGDLSAGTYMQGEMYTIDLPDGKEEIPQGTFFADIQAGETDFTPDLIREGDFTITANSDGTFTVKGVLTGSEYLKRYFEYTGEFDPIDRSDEGTEPEIPNSNLTGDIALSGLTQSRLIDKKDYFFLGDESYRLFLLYIAEPTVDLTNEWPSGTGRLLRLELFVPWESKLADGIPEGTYTMANRIEGGGIPREDIVPFRIVEGYPNVFQYNTGTWYQELTGGVWTNYGRIMGGTVEVERYGDAHTLTINLTDCSTPAHNVSGTWHTDTAIPFN